jgi:hypothetical protein
LDRVARARKPRRAGQLTPSHPIPRAGRRATQWSWKQRRGKVEDDGGEGADRWGPVVSGRKRKKKG